MRFIASLLLCVGIALAVAGCDPSTDRMFFRQGIGTELNSGDIVASTAAQNEYANYVCQQAGLQLTADGNCGNSSPRSWQLFVQAGMNDVDQRCDAYLQWVDYVRRGRDPALNIISDASTYSALILDKAGVSSAPIAIVGAALGFARNTFTNVTSRLILEVNHSAVQSVVLSAQKHYREELFGSVEMKIPPVEIASKPAAIYALRSYLRLCMPVTIEAEINNTVVTFARGGGEALDNQEPLVSGRNVGVARITNPNAPTPKGPTGQKPLAGDTRIGEFEEKILPDRIKLYQDALCVTPADKKLGGVSSTTRAAIGEYLVTLGTTNTSKRFDRRTTTFLDRAVDFVGSCSKRCLANPYEVAAYGMPSMNSTGDPVENVKKKITTLRTQLNKLLAGKGIAVSTTDTFCDATDDKVKLRTAIAEVRKLLNPNDPKAAENTSANHELDKKLNAQIFQ